ncbi:COG3772 Phage-related lysozyme (muraminidase) [uncultured Caudovirales phage]|uniref:Endolysin n=1 Tax=uncultured Caudovirales phage TaxID=2100421 RepID=A0A6J5NMC9_9CAUD|nr:COG3772 Phage-related lysozyme (muraminidase) [uncultured Caudovirales phage]
MKINKAGTDLIIRFEGGHILKSYRDPINIWTISVGLTRIYNRSVVESDIITLEESEKLFRIELNRFCDGVTRLLFTRLTENQFSALVSISFNIGLGALRGSTLLKMVNRNPNDPLIRNEFLRWNKINKIESRGLTRRRKAESDLYFS